MAYTEDQSTMSGAPKPASPEDVNPDITPKPLAGRVKPLPPALNPATPAVPTPGTSAVPATMPSAVPTAVPAAPSQMIPSTGGDSFGGSALTPAPPAAPATSTVGGGVALTPTNPNAPLTSQTIAPGALADRAAVAKQQWDTWLQGSTPAYQAALRDAKRAGAAVGGLGSGQLRTRVGDLAAERANAMDVKGQEFLTQANLGSMDDVWRSIGVAQQQQGFQQAQQQQAFENELRRLGFSDQMLNSAFGRALQTYMAGQQGGTGSGTALAGAGQAAGQGEDALTALANLIRSQAAGGGNG